MDALGNLIARKGQAGKKIMLAAHMDEIGVIVTHIDEKGFARFTNLGGVRASHLPGSRVRFLNGARGVIGQEREDRERVMRQRWSRCSSTWAPTGKTVPCAWRM